MLLLTWHGTILRVEQSQNRLIHAPLVPVRAVARDLAYDGALPGGMVLAAGAVPGTMHVLREDRLLTASPDLPFPSFEDGPADEAHALLPVTERQVAALRALLATPHRHTETGEEHGAAALLPGFRLAFGPHVIDLLSSCPEQAAESGIFFGDAGTFVAVLGAPSASEVALLPIPPSPPTGDPATFQAADAAILVLDGPPELRFLPLTANFAVRDWFYASGVPEVGARMAQNLLGRQREAFLLGGATIFTKAGVLHGLLPPPGPWPAGFQQEADHFFIDAASLDAAPHLPGPHAWLPPPCTSLLLETILPLILMAPHLPSDTTLLLPSGADPAAFAALLALFGFGNHAWAAPPQLCRVDALFWPARCGLADLAADAPKAARMLARRPRGAVSRRLFVPVGLVNSSRLATVAAAFGFDSVDPTSLDHAARADLFAGANAVVAAHGAVLENLVFCAEETLVVELTSDSVWDPRYSRLSDQLGLTHAVVPCAAEPGGLRGEPQALRALLRLMPARA